MPKEKTVPTVTMMVGTNDISSGKYRKITNSRTILNARELTLLIPQIPYNFQEAAHSHIPHTTE